VRPSRLAFENFGPYRARAEVDFSRLGPVFLVWGKTGSGKTSIFDAMTYALYGVAPGSRGGLERQLWSHYAQPGEKPLVEFEFFLGGEEYRAVRQPPYKRRNRKGELADAPAEALLYRRESGEWRLLANKITEVDAIVEARMGLSEDEFSKIILLPQGEFQRFLDMDSTERVSVLEKLFPVAIHDAVARLAKEESKVALAAVQSVDASLARMGGADAAEDESAEFERLVRDVESLTASRAAALAELGRAESELALGRAAADRAARAAEASDRLAVLEAAWPEATARRVRISAARAAAAALPRVEAAAIAAAALAEGSAALATREAELAAYEERRAEIDASRVRASDLSSVAAALDGELGELRAASAAWQASIAAEGLATQARVAEEEARARERDARVAEEEERLRLGEVAVGPEEEARVRAAFEEARANVDAAAERDRAATESAESARRIAALEEAVLARGSECVAAADARSRAESALAALELLARRGQAATLAARLVEGEPCPVCGSAHHPAPAVPDVDGAPSAASLGEAKRLRDAALAAEASASAALRAAESASREARAGLGAGEEPMSPEAAKRRCESAREALAAHRAELKSAAEALRAMEERRRLAASLAVEVEKKRSLLMASSDSLARTSEERAARDAALFEARSRSGAVDPAPRLAASETRRAEARAEAARLEAETAEWDRGRTHAFALAQDARARAPGLAEASGSAALAAAAAIVAAGFGGEAELRAALLADPILSSLESEAAAYERDLASARSASAALAAPEGSAPPNIAELEERSHAARRGLEEAQAALAAACAGRDGMSRAIAERARLVAEREALQTRWSALAGLSAILNGELPGRRLPFKHFVLGAYFSSVAQRAAIRLSQMSDGRYSLVVDEGAASGKGKIGLDLSVRDAFTGQARPAGTLSGGERFLTSLALALGLADAIRERSGGASLDAVFIDEGFGSLDDESLDRAISALDAARGARTIGIVSHVAELRARIPSRIEVAKGRVGSTLSII
jgi:exonuclease SbcC